MAERNRSFSLLTLPAQAPAQRVRTRRVSARPSDTQFPVLLISMPFGPLLQPSLGLSLLKASLAPVRCKILYFTFSLAQRLGASFYNWVAEGNPSITSLLGEWIFSAALFDSAPGGVEEYLEKVLRRELSGKPVPKKIFPQIRRAREGASEFLDACVAVAQCFAPRIVGFTSVFQQQLASLGLAKRLKDKLPDTFIVFGGANCEGVMGLELLRQFPFVDAAVSGEGDQVFSQLADRVLTGQPLTGLQGVYTKQSVASGTVACLSANAPFVREMDTLPYPDYEDFFEQWNSIPITRGYTPRVLFETSRGCWWGERHHCTFCGLNGASMAYRSKSAQRALKELLYLARRYPGCSILAVDNILDMKYFWDFLPTLARRRLPLQLFYEVKANLKKEQVQLLREAGITQIQPGIESFSDRILQLMRKGVTGLQNIQLLKWCKELGVQPYWNIIWGFPGESPEEYKRMADWVPLLTHLPPPDGAGSIRLDRFSPNFDQRDQLGLTNASPCPAYRFIYPLDWPAVANLAYYFTFEYGDRRDVAVYTRRLAEQIDRWQKNHCQSELFYLDKGTDLLVWDVRPGALKKLTVLRGLQRSLYLACDRVRRISQLARELAEEIRSAGSGEEGVDVLLKPLLQQGLMIRDGDRVLSLAVRRGSDNWPDEGHPGGRFSQTSKASQRSLTLSMRGSKRGSSRILSRKGSSLDRRG